jgi:hypothetical protein
MKKVTISSKKLNPYLLGTIFLLLMYSSVNAANYYVATNGNNSNPGTLLQPWLTIQYAANNVAPGDTVYIREGSYAKWKVNVSGTINNPIIFKNYPGELPVINGNWVDGPGVEIRGVSYIIIDGIKFHQLKGDNFRGNGVHIEGSTNGVATPASNIIVRNCKVDGTSNAGIYVCGLIMGSTIPVNNYRTFDITIENNDVTNTNYPSGGNECISLGGGTDGFIIRNNYVHDSRQYGIDAKFGARNGQIYGNVIHNMEKHGIYIDTNSRTLENIDIYNNFVYNCKANGLTLARESAREPKVPMMRNIRIFDNVFTGCRRGIMAYIHPNDNLSGDFKNISIVNNTIHDNNRDIDPHSIKIIDISQVQNHGGWIIANNLTTKNAGPALINSSGSDWIITKNANSSTDAPYVDAANLDFHLVNGSIADGAADAAYLCKNTDYDGVSRGTPPDCGAFEYTGPSTHTQNPLIEEDKAYTLSCYPNPFNQNVIINFGIPLSGEGKLIELSVNNARGHLVSELVNNNRSSGMHEIEFNASELSAGVYIFRLQCEERVLTQRTLLIK